MNNEQRGVETMALSTITLLDSNLPIHNNQLKMPSNKYLKSKSRIIECKKEDRLSGYLSEYEGSKRLEESYRSKSPFGKLFYYHDQDDDQFNQKKKLNAMGRRFKCEIRRPASSHQRIYPKPINLVGCKVIYEETATFDGHGWNRHCVYRDPRYSGPINTYPDDLPSCFI